MNLSGGYWMWGAALRYIFALPILALILAVMPGDQFGPLIKDIKKKPFRWILWSTVGFGLFYLPLSLGSVYGESWMVAACWQLTIVCGVLLTPLFGKKIPVKNLLIGALILVGIFILQSENMTGNGGKQNLLALLPILLAAFCYPLGNRKTMEHCPAELSTIQRVFGMTLCSIPFWLLVSCISFANAGAPDVGQILHALAVALFSSCIATLLFFHATDLVKGNPKHLAIIEATQCGEVIFTLIGGILFLGDKTPGVTGWIGLVLIIGGMILNH